MHDFTICQKIDIHIHVNLIHAAFLEQARADNFKLLTINVAYPGFPSMEKQQKIAISLMNEYPEIITWASTFPMTGWGEPGWDERTIRHLDNTFAKGAIAVKVWKNIGMEFRNKNHKLVMIDDPGFDSILLHLQRKKIPLIGHLGDPRNCWLPVDQMTVNNDKEYYKQHPQYHMFQHPELPSYEEQLAARDRMLRKNPDLQFLASHLASLEWSVDEIAKFLDRFPMASVDLAERMGYLQYQGQYDQEKVREFVIRYQDRILYATDLMVIPGMEPEESARAANKKWLQDWNYLNSDLTLEVPELDEPVKGLALPKEVVEKIYHLNAEKLFPSAWKRN
jgi:hypothetical protein